MLGNDDAALGGQAAGCGAGGFHEGLPVSTGGVGFGAGIAGDEFGGFRGADGFAAVAVDGALGEEGENRCFQCGVVLGWFVAAAGFGAEAEDIPVAGVLLGPADGALAGFTEFFFVGGGAVGFGFSVWHLIYSTKQRWGRWQMGSRSRRGEE